MNIVEVNIDALEMAAVALMGEHRANILHEMYRVVDQAMTKGYEEGYAEGVFDCENDCVVPDADTQPEIMTTPVEWQDATPPYPCCAAEDAALRQAVENEKQFLEDYANETAKAFFAEHGYLGE